MPPVFIQDGTTGRSHTFFGDMEVITEVTPDGRVHFLILEVDYVEGPVRLDSPDARELLDDAGLIG